MDRATIINIYHAISKAMASDPSLNCSAWFRANYNGLSYIEYLEGLRNLRRSLACIN